MSTARFVSFAILRLAADPTEAALQLTLKTALTKALAKLVGNARKE